MTPVVTLLRGVNVGGHGKISMEDLRDICVSLKLRDPQTYIQSGNVVFGAAEPDLAKLADRLESAIEKRLAFRPKVILRSADDLRKIVALNPFARRAGFEPAKLAVFFLPDAPVDEIRRNLLAHQGRPGRTPSPKAGNSTSTFPTAWAAPSFRRSSTAL